MPSSVLPEEVCERYRHLVLANPYFNVPAHVDMLVGGDLYPFVMQAKADVIHSNGLPSAMSTQLGWVVFKALHEPPSTSLISLSISTKPPIDELMRQFWTVEEPMEGETNTTQDQLCEEWFQRTTQDETGRFSVGLPFRLIVCPTDKVYAWKEH